MDHLLTRKLTGEEYELSRWLLAHGNEDAEAFINQLDEAEVTLWKCGCASFNFGVQGLPEAEPGVHVLSDYVFGGESELAGIFIFSYEGIFERFRSLWFGSGSPG
jgi:hypothetical protein